MKFYAIFIVETEIYFSHSSCQMHWYTQTQLLDPESILPVLKNSNTECMEY